MALTNPEIRVLASLIEKEAAVPESYPLTLSALRLACNQSTNRRPVVAYDDRTVENALMSLKSVGLVRFVHPSHGGRTTRYRQTAGERWRLSVGESLVLSALALRGPQTAADVLARVGRLLPADETATVEDMLDTLAARSPEPLAVRLGRRPGERDDRWVAALGDGEAGDHDDVDLDKAIDSGGHDPELGDVDIDAAFDRSTRDNSGGDALAERVDQLSAALLEVTARLERLERELGVS
ncbi:MAG: YceH family protein [Actinomycetota bacterium]|nr:YceH family protein [Actinomycetota bacterium]